MTKQQAIGSNYVALFKYLSCSVLSFDSNLLSEMAAKTLGLQLHLVCLLMAIPPKATLADRAIALRPFR